MARVDRCIVRAANHTAFWSKLKRYVPAKCFKMGHRRRILRLYKVTQIHLHPSVLFEIIWNMMISERLRALRESKNMSQGDIEARTGLKRCYVSRVENGHTVPSVDTLEKFARALEVPMYRLFTDEA